MAVTLTLQQLADHLRLDRAAATSTDVRYVTLSSLFESGKAEVERYAPNAPSAVANQALAQLAGYRYDAPPAGRGGSTAYAFDYSGAKALLAAYHDIVSARVGEGEGPEAASQAGGGGGTTGQTAQQVADAITAHAGMADVHHVPTPPGGGGGDYTLPQATESELGGVRGATQAQAEGASGTTILGWTNNRIRRLIRLIYTAAEKTKLAGIETNAERNVGQQYTSAEKSKLAGVETSATADQTPAQIVGAVNSNLGNTDWQTPGEGDGGGGTPTEQRVLQQDPVGDATTDGKFQIAPNGFAYSTIPDIELGTLATGDFENFDHTNYIGAFGGDPNPLSVPLGTYYFLTVDHKLRKTANNAFNQARWQDAPWSEILPAAARYRGNHDTDEDALHHLTMDGDVYHRDELPHRGIRQVSNFVAGTNSHTDYGTKRLAFADEIEEVTDLFVERSNLPDPAAADAPILVRLTHAHREGNRADASITVGFNNGVAGYSSGELAGALGSIDVVSPLLELFGVGEADDYLIESVYWPNASDLDGFDDVYLNAVRYSLGPLTPVPGGTVWLKRILDYPTGLALATLSINFARADGTWYYNDSADALLDAGLYQLVEDGQGTPIYDVIPTRGITHRDSIGAPAVPPTRAGVIDIDDTGRMWAAAGQVHVQITPPTGTTEQVPDSELGTQHVDNVSGFADLIDRGGLGAWYAQTDHFNFFQYIGVGPPPVYAPVNTFHDVYDWIIDNVTGGDTVANRFFRDDTTMLGLYSHEADALLELQFVLGGEAFPAVTTHQYLYVNANHGGAGSNIRRITTYDPGQFLRSDDFRWNQQADTRFVSQAIAAHAAQESAHHVKTPPGGMGGGLDATAVEALITAHGAMPNVHHVPTPPGGGGDAASVDGFSFVSLTQAEYDALTPDANTVYLVTA